jgi:hypothetical protein
MTDNRKNKPSVIPPVWIMNMINGLQRFLIKLSKNMVPPSIWMVNHIENLWLAKGLATAIELDIALHIQQGKNTIGQLAEVTQTNQDALFRLMRMLCAHDIFRLSKNNRYTLTRYSEVLLESKDSVKYFLMSHLSKTHFELFAEMDYSMKTGSNATQKLYQKDIFSYMQDQPDKQELFIKGMGETSELFAPVFLSSYNLKPFHHVVDVAGGHGSLLCHILSSWKHLKATLFDNKHIIEKASENIRSFGLAERIDIKAGDFFTTVPEGGDLYLLKNILHDWDDEHNIIILKNVAKAMSGDAKLLVVECLIENNNTYHYGKMLDILMLLGTKNGRERTLDEYKRLFEKSGFEINKVIPTISPFSLIECIKT